MLKVHEITYIVPLTLLSFYIINFYYWLLVLASFGHHQANIYKKLKMLVHIEVDELYYMKQHF